MVRGDTLGSGARQASEDMTDDGAGDKKHANKSSTFMRRPLGNIHSNCCNVTMVGGTTIVLGGKPNFCRSVSESSL